MCSCVSNLGPLDVIAPMLYIEGYGLRNSEMYIFCRLPLVCRLEIQFFLLNTTSLMAFPEGEKTNSTPIKKALIIRLSIFFLGFYLGLGQTKTLK